MPIADLLCKPAQSRAIDTIAIANLNRQSTISIDDQQSQSAIDNRKIGTRQPAIYNDSAITSSKASETVLPSISCSPGGTASRAQFPCGTMQRVKPICAASRTRSADCEIPRTSPAS